MEKGALISGMFWKKEEGYFIKMSRFQLFNQGQKGVFAYRCPKCGKVELTTETK